MAYFYSDGGGGDSGGSDSGGGDGGYGRSRKMKEKKNIHLSSSICGYIFANSNYWDLVPLARL